jgi:hypothetical protein
MKAKDITKEAVLTYLESQGTSEEQLFSDQTLYRYTEEGFLHLKNMYSHFTGFEMTSDGLIFRDTENLFQIEVSNMTDFNQVHTVSEAITNMKYIHYVKEAHLIKERRENELHQRRDESELER